MKKIKRIFIFITISISIQILVLFFFNNIYLIRNKAYVEAVKYMDSNGIYLPQGATSIRVSFDGKYVGYLSDGKLKVSCMDNGQEIPITKTKAKVSFLKWLPDRNLIIYAKTVTALTVNNLEIETMDLATGDERSYPTIKNMPANSEIIGIELSPLTNIVYLKIKMNAYEMDIYKCDIMDNIKYVMTAPLKTIIKELNFKDILIYQNNPDSIIQKSGNSKLSEKISLQKDGVLLGTDYEDSIYIGELDNEKNIKRIMVKKDNKKTWTQIVLQKAYNPKDINITSKGDIICLNGESLYIANKDKTIKFNGICLDVLNDYVIINNNGYLNTEKIKL
jgi:hypothetical protein